MKKYVFNLETTKIELHFEKSEYDSLTDQQKSDLKSGFLWSRSQNAWVSRSKEPNLWRAKKIANSLGFTEEERINDRITFSEQLQKKADRAEARAERYEQYAQNAETRAAALQKPLNDMHGDIAFFTQPNINSSAGRAFTNYRNKLYARFDRGFDEYRKSEYFKNRAETARDTAEMSKLNDVAYLDRKTKELKKEIKKRFENVDKYDEYLKNIESGKPVKRYDGSEVTKEEINKWLSHELELIDVATDKLAFYTNAFEMAGGAKFSKENIKVGYIVKIKRWGLCEIISAGKVNVQYKILSGGASGYVGTAAYAEIVEIVEEREQQKENHPFKIGDTFKIKVWDNGDFREKQFVIIKTTESTVKLQCGEEKPILRKPVKSKFDSDKWYLSITDGYSGTVYKKSKSEVE